MPIVIGSTDLGPNNQGTIGPDNSEVTSNIESSIALPVYSRKSTNRFRCIDGRIPEGGLDVEEGYADGGVPGGIAVTESFSDMMDVEFDEDDNELPSLNWGELLGKNTKAAVYDGLRVVVHGDQDHDEEGCAAHKKARDALWFNAENSDIVAPLTWTIVAAAGASEYLAEDMVNASIVKGLERADNKELWKITPKEGVETILANGGEYERLIGKHNEKAARVDLSESTFDEEAFMQDHVDEDGLPIQLFSATLGAYYKSLRERAEKHERSEVWAAKKLMHTILHLLGTGKIIGNENLHAFLVDEKK